MGIIVDSLLNAYSGFFFANIFFSRFFNLFLLFLVNSRNSCFASSDLRLCIVLN